VEEDAFFFAPKIDTQYEAGPVKIGGFAAIHFEKTRASAVVRDREIIADSSSLTIKGGARSKCSPWSPNFCAIARPISGTP
jgi:hypothetical protein